MALDHWNLKSLIGGKRWDCPTLLYSKAWGPKGPRRFEHWILRQSHLKEVGVTQNWKTIMWLQHLTTIGFTITYCGEGPTWRGWQWNSIRLRAQPHMSLHYTWKAHIHTKFTFSFAWYDLWMSFEGLKCKLAPHLLQRFQNLKDMWKCYLRIGW